MSVLVKFVRYFIARLLIKIVLSFQTLKYFTSDKLSIVIIVMGEKGYFLCKEDSFFVGKMVFFFGRKKSYFCSVWETLFSRPSAAPSSGGVMYYIV